MRKRIEFEISPGTLLWMAAMLLIMPVRWVFALVLAMTVHEFWHYLAIAICRGKVYRMQIGAGQIRMETPPLEPYLEMMCAAAGPVGSFSLLLFSRWLPVTALCGLVHGLYNLLPVFPLDGGRILHCGLRMLLPNHASAVVPKIEWCIFSMIVSGLIYVAVQYRLHGLALMVIVAVLMKLYSEKKTLQRIDSEGTIEIH